MNNETSLVTLHYMGLNYQGFKEVQLKIACDLSSDLPLIRQWPLADFNLT